ARVPGAAGTLASAEEITLSAGLTGTVGDPGVTVDFMGAGSPGDAVRSALEAGASQAVEQMEARLDSVADAARQRAAEEAAQLLAAAEAQARTIRDEAAALAEAARSEGYQQADALVARGGNPIEQRLAQAAAD